MDPGKLKVVELRVELSKRGLDSKGNKPVLVERLRQALEEEQPSGNATCKYSWTIDLSSVIIKNFIFLFDVIINYFSPLLRH